MFCKNCGSQLNPGAYACMNCGVAANQGFNYCANCGGQTMPGAVVCTKCGAPLMTNEQMAENDPNAKSKLMAGLLGIFLGGLGVHRFYLGYTGIGVAQILANVFLGAGCLWGFIEGIVILCGTGITKDADGRPLKK